MCSDLTETTSMYAMVNYITRRVRKPVKGDRQKLRTYLRVQGVAGKFVVNSLSDGSFRVELKSEQDFTLYPSEFENCKIFYTSV